MVSFSYHLYFNFTGLSSCRKLSLNTMINILVSVEKSNVYSNTWWSSSAESAIVFAESIAIDTYEGTKMVITGNVVYDNVNKIP